MTENETATSDRFQGLRVPDTVWLRGERTKNKKISDPLRIRNSFLLGLLDITAKGGNSKTLQHPFMLKVASALALKEQETRTPPAAEAAQLSAILCQGNAWSSVADCHTQRVLFVGRACEAASETQKGGGGRREKEKERQERKNICCTGKWNLLDVSLTTPLTEPLSITGGHLYFYLVVFCFCRHIPAGKQRQYTPLSRTVYFKGYNIFLWGCFICICCRKQ